MFLWKLYNFNTNEQRIEKEELAPFGGPVWRVSWSLAGNMLAVSSANNNETSVQVFQVIISYFFIKPVILNKLRKMNKENGNYYPK